MYLKDKDIKITIRVSKDLYDKIIKLSGDLYIKPSELIRSILSKFLITNQD